jgi:phenylacetate-CoA ligase
VVQKTLDSLLIRLVLRPGDHTSQLTKMEAEVHRVLGPTIAVRLEAVAEIPLTPSGKFRVSISEL